LPGQEGDRLCRVEGDDQLRPFPVGEPHRPTRNTDLIRPVPLDRARGIKVQARAAVLGPLEQGRLLGQAVPPQRVQEVERAWDKTRVKCLKPQVLLPVQVTELERVLGPISGNVHDARPGEALVDPSVAHLIDLDIRLGHNQGTHIAERPQVPRSLFHYLRLFLRVLDLLTIFAMPFESISTDQPDRAVSTASAIPVTSPDTLWSTTPE